MQCTCEVSTWWTFQDDEPAVGEQTILKQLVSFNERIFHTKIGINKKTFFSPYKVYFDYSQKEMNVARATIVGNMFDFYHNKLSHSMIEMP